MFYSESIGNKLNNSHGARLPSDQENVRDTQDNIDEGRGQAAPHRPGGQLHCCVRTKCTLPESLATEPGKLNRQHYLTFV